MFREDLCTGCGTCLTACPYTNYSTHDAAAMLNALVRGKYARILSTCITCMACNERCPEDAYPFDLIADGQERHRIRPVSEGTCEMIDSSLSMIPTSVTYGSEGSPALNMCVMEHAYPEAVAQSALFRGMTVMKGSDFYSRVVHLHLGSGSLMRQNAARYMRSLEATGVQSIVFLHEDCYVMAAKIAPALGIEAGFTPVHIIEHMNAFLDKNPDMFRPVQRRLAFQRPCISRYVPEEEILVDGFFERLEAVRVNRTYDRKNALCCGIGLSADDPNRARDITQKNIQDALMHEARAMVFLCPSCYAFLGPACEQQGLPAVFITDLCAMAIGEKEIF